MPSYSQYSKEKGLHNSWDDNADDTTIAQQVSAVNCEIFAEQNRRFKKDYPIDQYKCVCGSTTFNVFQVVLQTAIKCAQCGNESSIHEG